MKIHGLPVKNATSPLTVTITAADVRLGGVKRPDKCAAARAICRDESAEALVFLSRVYVKKGDEKHWTRYNTPQSLKTEIVSFDRGGSFDPGSFNLMAPTKIQKKARGSDTNRNRPRHLKQKRGIQHVFVGVRPHASTEIDKEFPKHYSKSRLAKMRAARAARKAKG